MVPIMDMQFQILCFTTFVLVLTSLIYGIKFLKRRNYLLGIEWLIVTFSAANFLFFFLTDVRAAYNVSYFCDAFSRGFGIPIVTTAGLMAVTHNYRPSLLTDVLLFAGALAGGTVLVAVDAVAPVKPYFYLVMWSAFSLYLAYLAWRLLNLGELAHAVGVVLVLLSAQAIASIYDFYQLPGDQDHMLFYILASSTWAYLCVQMYYAYGALERAQQRTRSPDPMFVQMT